jgi:hypothetical protein
MKEMKHWKGPVTFTKKEHRDVFPALHWLAQAVSTDPTRYNMSGIYNEITGGNRVFVATDGRHYHRVMFPGKPAVFAGIPAGKNTCIKADSKQVTFTEEIDAAFPPYKECTPDITGVTPFCICVRKDNVTGYTEALYELYLRGLKINMRHVEGLANIGCGEWSIYGQSERAVVCTQEMSGMVYTMVSAALPKL